MEERTRLAGRPFRFFEGGEECLLLVAARGEKWALAQRPGAAVSGRETRSPAPRSRGAGSGHGAALGQRTSRDAGRTAPGRPGDTRGSAWFIDESLAAAREA